MLNSSHHGPNALIQPYDDYGSGVTAPYFFDKEYPYASTNGYMQEQQMKANQSRKSSSMPHWHARYVASLARQQPAVQQKRLSQDDPTGHVKTKLLEAANGHDDRLNNNGGISSSDSSDDEENGTAAWHVLDMGGQRLKHLAPPLFRYTFLTALFINHNQLTYLPSEIRHLPLLEILDASGNLLTSLPPEIGILVALKELLLFDNRLTALPAEIGMLFQLDVLGIEGNPLVDDLHILASKGTHGLIENYRENLPVGTAPPPRQWINLVETSGEDQDAFVVLCYNTLCPMYVNHGKYGYTPSWSIEWDYRKDLLLSEIQDLEADVVCLQEVATIHYETVFQPFMKTNGNYEGLFYPKSRSKTMDEDQRQLVDGCAIFYKASRYKRINHMFVEFTQKALERPDFKESKDTYNRLMLKDNIAIFVLLEDMHTKKRLVVTNVHVHWNEAFSDVKLVQIGIMMDELLHFIQRSGHAALPIVMCGDYNARPGTGIHQFLLQGALNAGHPEFLGHVYGRYTSEGIRHNFKLKSSYGHIGELDYTNYTIGFKGVLDYIFYSSNLLEPLAVLGPLDRDYMATQVSLPTPHFPSDHIPLVTEFRFTD